MKARAHQALFGYDNGHRLLAASTSFSSEDSVALLKNSDLSGARIDSGFEEYSTGFPINDSGAYAFCRTWYAREMPRPGCAWTHVLLIAFADLGRIVDIGDVAAYFSRPDLAIGFDDYQQPLEFEYKADIESIREFDTGRMACIMESLYALGERPVVIPSTDSKSLEGYVYFIWNNQWPRLRRIFKFCTGAQNVMELLGRPFDLHVIPQTSLPRILRISPEVTVVKNAGCNDLLARTIYQEQRSVRKFLYLYGADVISGRKSYFLLVRLYRSLFHDVQGNKAVVSLLACFPGREALKLKQTVFGADNIFRLDQREVISEVLTNSDREPFAVVQDLLFRGVASLFQSGVITVEDLFDYLHKLPDHLMIEEIWSQVEFSLDSILALLSRDVALLSQIGDRLYELAVYQPTWTCSHPVQSAIYEALNGSSADDNYLFKVFQCMRSVGSPSCVRMIGDHCALVQRTLMVLQGNNSQDILIFELIFNRWHNELSVYLNSAASSVPSEFAEVIFQKSTLKDLLRFDLSDNALLAISGRIEPSASCYVYSRCMVLSLGFHLATHHPYKLVAEVFESVFIEAKNGRISRKEWEVIPRQQFKEIEDVEVRYFLDFWSWLPRKRIVDVPEWDHCELLIRTIAYKFIRHDWPEQYLIDALKSYETCHRTFLYLLSHKRGREYLGRLHKRIQSRMLRIQSHHAHAINNIERNNR